jgi:hypothetical protein
MSKNVAYNANLNGFVPFERYYFEFSGLGGNWPAIVSPASGYFTTDNEGKYNLVANVSFCANTGSIDCNPSSDGYLAFNENLLIDLDLFNTLQLDIKDSNDISVLSKTDKVDCPECRPSLDIETPNFVNLLKSNDAQADFNVHIDGLEIGESYNYEIRSLFGNWPMYVTPSGGSFKSYEQTKTLTFTVDVCESGTNCATEGLMSEYELDDRDSYYAGFKFVLIDSDDVEDSSSVVEAICENCLPDAPEILTVQNQILTATTSDTNTRSVDIVNLNKTRTYYYVVENIVTDSDIVVYPQSGTIVNKAQYTFELDTVFCSSSECVASSDYIAANSQGANYIGVQPHDVTFDIKLYSSYDGMNYSGLITSLDNIKTTCDKCVKIPTVSLNNNLENITLTNTNMLSVVGAVGNLEIGKQYKYTINNASSTWPVEIMKPSGLFTARSATKNISSSIKFCEASGICPDAAFDVNDIDYDYQNVILNMTIETLNSTTEDVISDNLNIICDKCIEDHRIGNINNSVYPQSYTVENISVTNDIYNFSTRFDNLVIGQEYTYTINVTDSNWPTYLHKHSGTFTADTSFISLPNHIRLCPTSNGECSQENLTISEIGDLSTRLDDIYFNFNINLSGELVDVNLDSHNIEIKCNDCLETIEFTNVSSSINSANPSNANPVGDMVVSAAGFEPDLEYFYIVNSGNGGSWPFIIRNLSGYFTPSTDTHDITIPYEVVSNTGLGMYDLSHTLSYVYDPNSLLKYKDISVTIGSYDADINDSISRNHRLLCEGCFDDPNTNFLSVSVPSIQGNTIEAAAPVVNIDFVVAGAVDGYRYGYRLISESSNWPYSINIPSTGYITAAEGGASLGLQATFCATSGGACFSDRFNTEINSAMDMAEDYEDIINTLSIEVSGLSGDPLITNMATSEITLTCNAGASRSCINTLSTIVSNEPDHKYVASALNINNPSVSDYTFYYQVNGSNLNWPIDLLQNHTGYIRGDEELELQFSPCATTGGSCALNSPFTYSLPSCSDSLNQKMGTFDIHYSGVDIDINSYNTDDFDVVFNDLDLATIFVTNNVGSANSIINSSNGPDINLDYSVSNLYPGEEYGYKFSISNSNWPVDLSSHTGTFTADSVVQDLSTVLQFCNRVDGSCADNVDTANLISYTLDDLNPKATIILSVSGNCDINDGISLPHTIECQSCLDNIDFDNIEDVTLTADDNFNLSLDLTNSNGFDSSKSYFYQITRHNSNWPIHVDSMSGTISNTNILTIPFYFCPTSSGTCSLHSNTFASNPEDCLIKNHDKYGTFDVMVSGSGLDLDNKTSNKFTITANSALLSAINIDIDRSSFILDENTGNRFVVDYNISNITTGDTYLYNIHSINANWPVRILEGANGSFVATNDSHTLQLTVEMCASTGNSCGLDALEYTPNQNCLKPIDPVYIAGLGIDVWVSGSSGCEVADGKDTSVSMSCSNCLGNIAVTPPAETTLTESNTYSLGFDISGLKNGQSYTFEFSAEDANWPVSLTPISGEFTAVGSIATIVSEMMFCYPSGLCAGQDNALPYTEYTYYDKITKGSNLFSSVKLTVTPDSECEEMADTSDAVNIVCQDCLPAFSYASIVMSGSPEISLPESCCTGSMPLYVNVSNAVPGESYTYNFSASSQNITFNPVSGTVYLDGTGAGTLITTVESELDLYGMSIIQCELIHDNTQEKVIDMIAMRCGESCPVE